MGNLFKKPKAPMPPSAMSDPVVDKPPTEADIAKESATSQRKRKRSTTEKTSVVSTMLTGGGNKLG